MVLKNEQPRIRRMTRMKGGPIAGVCEAQSSGDHRSLSVQRKELARPLAATKEIVWSWRFRRRKIRALQTFNFRLYLREILFGGELIGLFSAMRHDFLTADYEDGRG